MDADRFGTEIKAIGDQLIDVIKRHLNEFEDYVTVDCDISTSRRGQELKATITFAPPGKGNRRILEELLKMAAENPDRFEVFTGKLLKDS